MNRVAQWLLNIVVGLFCYILFVVMFFPIEPIVKNYLGRVEVMTKGNYRVNIEQIHANLFFQSVFKNVTVFALDEGQEQPILRFPEVRVGVRYLPLISGNVYISFSAKGKKGGFEGKLAWLSASSKFDIKLKDFDIVHLPVLNEGMGLPLSGKIDGQVQISFDSENERKNDGRIDLTLKNFKLFESEFDLTAFQLALPDLQITGAKDAKIVLSMKGNRVQIDSFKLDGPDLMMDLAGSYQLNRRASLSIINLNGILKLSDPVLKAIPELITQSIANQENEDGSFPLGVSGRINCPRVRLGTFQIPLPCS